MIRRNCGRVFIVLTPAVLTLLLLGLSVYQRGTSEYIDIQFLSFDDDAIVSTDITDGSPRLRTSINITLTTGASSREFLSLLQFLETFAMLQPKYRHQLVVWDLGLRACQVNFLLKRLQSLGIQLQLKDFPFTSYPLYFRSIKGIWKPVVIKEVVDEFGAALWLDPELQLNMNLTDILMAIDQNGFVALSSSMDLRHNYACGSSIVGFQKENNVYNVLKEWRQLAFQVMLKNCTYSSTIAKASCGDTTINWADHTLSLLALNSKKSCKHFVHSEVHAHETPLQKYYASEQNSICPNASDICILTGNQTYSNTRKFSVASALRQNKERYASTHGYRFIEGGRTYLERKNSGYSAPYWGKIDSILENLEDCKLLLFVDSDVIFTNFSTKLESFFALPEAKGKDMLISKPLSSRTVNTGVILMRSTENIRALLLASMDPQSWPSDWSLRFGYDQSAMWNLVGPVHSIWRDVIHVFEGDHTLQALCGFSDGNCLWRPGDFIAHFAPPRSPAELMARFMKEHSDIVHVNK